MTVYTHTCNLTLTCNDPSLQVRTEALIKVFRDPSDLRSVLIGRKPALKTSPGSRTPDQLLIPPHVPSYADLKTVLDVCSELLWW
ncbi:hypothetical protein ILYODFUR_033133 [Ilyodon furcidens]|uniref:Uncharacterized protein n=1 Tax=Ilyodon furcidens TaxID=33524 RepID=A0ABV0TNX0_9TELE